MSLEPISFNTQNTSEKSIQQKLKTISEIKQIIYAQTKIEVKIKKIQPPLLVIVVSSSPAASDLNLQKDVIIKKLTNYKISQLRIYTN